MSKKRVICDEQQCYFFNDDSSNSDYNELLVPEQEWVVFGADWCGYCRRTCNLLRSKGMDYEFHRIDSLNPKEKKDLIQMTGGYTSIPKIFHNNKFIGGYSQLEEYFT